MAYRFRLENLLRLRQRQTEVAEFELARLFSAYGAVKDIIETLLIMKNGSGARLSGRLAGGGMPAGEYGLEKDYIETLDMELDRNRQRLFKLEQDIERAKEILAKRHQEKELVDRLKQKDLDAYTLEEQRGEQKRADDLASIKYVQDKI